MSISYKINECAICLSDISETDIVAICTKCKRPFCTTCICIQEMYFENNDITPSCPTCRRKNVEFKYISKFSEVKPQRSIIQRLCCCVFS